VSPRREGLVAPVRRRRVDEQRHAGSAHDARDVHHGEHTLVREIPD